MILIYLIFGFFLSIWLVDESVKLLAMQEPEIYKDNTFWHIVVIGIITFLWPLIFFIL